MYICERDDDEFDEIDLDQPTSGICFWVLTEFNLNHRSVKTALKNKTDVMEPDSYATHPEAMEMADEYANEIKQIFHGSTVKHMDLEFMEDAFHIYILDKTNIPIAKIGVVAEYYRNLTIQ
jgi:hypothetical protein